MDPLRGPFRATEALDTGALTRYRLKTEFDALHRNVYLCKEQPLTAVTRAVAAWLWSDRQAVVAGRSAAALLGSKWIDDDLPAEIIRSSRDRVRGIVVHSDALSDDDITVRNGITLTTPARTAYDLGRRLSLTEALIHLDALARATGLDGNDVDRIAKRHKGARGLPRRSTQIVVRTDGEFVARIDMGWSQWRVGVEFDGAQHWTDPVQRTRDIDRLAELEALGWRIIRVSATLLRQRP